MKPSAWSALVTTVALSFLPACGSGMDDPRSLEGNTADGPTSQNLAQTKAAISLGGATYNLPARGGWGGSPSTLDCGTGYVTVGVFGRSGQNVDQLGLVCAYVNSDGSLGYQYYTGTVGGGGGNSFTFVCPYGEAVVGLQGRSGQLVDQVGVYCSGLANWRNTGSLQYASSTAGGTGGNYYSDICPTAYAVTALNLRGGQYIDQQQGVCTYINP